MCLSKLGIRGLAVNMRKAQDKAAYTDLTRGHSSVRATLTWVSLFIQIFSCPLLAVPCYPLHYSRDSYLCQLAACSLLCQTEFEFLSLVKFLARGNCCARCIYNVIWRCMKCGRFGLWKSYLRVQAITQGTVILFFKTVFTFWSKVSDFWQACWFAKPSSWVKKCQHWWCLCYFSAALAILCLMHVCIRMQLSSTVFLVGCFIFMMVYYICHEQ